MSSTNSQNPPSGNHPSHDAIPDSERIFCEFRRKVRASELLSASILNLLRRLKYTGKLNIILQNGEVLKSGYTEGYFRHRSDLSF
jgi:hypothetical protein